MRFRDNRRVRQLPERSLPRTTGEYVRLLERLEGLRGEGREVVSPTDNRRICQTAREVGRVEGRRLKGGPHPLPLHPPPVVRLDDGDGAAERARPAPRRVPPVHPLHLLFGFGVRMQGVGCEVQGVEWWQGRAGRCSEISGFGREFGGGGGHRKARAHLPGEEPRLPRGKHMDTSPKGGNLGQRRQFDSDTLTLIGRTQ